MADQDTIASARGGLRGNDLEDLMPPRGMNSYTAKPTLLDRDTSETFDLTGSN